MDTSHWNRENIAWFAGLFEGEGSIQVDEHGFYLTINMTDEDVLRRVQVVTGCGSVTGSLLGAANHKPMWKWKVRWAADLYALLVAIWPYLLSRRQAKATEALKHFAARPPVLKRVHGTWSSYSERKCRCDACVEAGKVAARTFRLRRKTRMLA